MSYAEITHRCPPVGSGIMPCCGRTPFEARGDRITTDPRLVTCVKTVSPVLSNKRRRGEAPRG